MNNNNANIIFHPVISSIQKVVVYETKTKFYLIGSNNRETRFRLLIIDRTAVDELRIHEDPNEISAKDIKRMAQNLSSAKITSAYGILGFVRFLEGYYLILVTKRTRCAFVGMHLIYTIKDTVMIRINELATKQPHPFEQRYVKMFQNVDLRSNFYFSYSYDLTRTLQYNMSAPKFVGSNVNIDSDEPLPDWNTLTNNVQSENERVDYAFRSQPRERFIWNAFLLKPAREHILLKDWLLEVTHGFISQSSISIFGRPIFVCLIARRSTKFAGTRFLKRGANFQGDVANEVETEQIVMDGHRLCSFTQMRGSIPSHWSQDVSKMVPKPPITLDLSDPFCETAAKHFERLLFHYGSPIIILNLVKKREKRKHESILSRELKRSIKYLNQFLPPQHRMIYRHFDMARQSRNGNVMESLANISTDVIKENGMFFKDRDTTTLQTGIVRVNCVDCLDRTNTAQFAIGKVALAHQLYNLGFIKPPKLEFDSDCVTMLENLYEDHGDTLALQYGGSQLVHRIKTYRKTAAWASQGNDIMQTLSRYFSNTFSDTEKQHSYNLFLGYYIPSKNDSKQNPPIWELQTDYYMHNYKSFNSNNDTKFLTDWVRHKVRSSLPHSCSDLNKIVKELFRVHSKDVEMIDSYSHYHMSFKLTEFNEHIAFRISQMAMRFMPTFRTNFSPFQPGRRREDRSSAKNPSLTGQSSTSSTTSSASSSSGCEEDSSSDDEFQTLNAKNRQYSTKIKISTTPLTFENLMPTMEDVYGCKIKQPSTESMAIYKKYVQIGRLSSQFYKNEGLPTNNKEAARINAKLMKGIQLSPSPNLKNDTSISVEPPKVSEKSIKIYEDYVNSKKTIVGIPSVKDLDVIIRYIKDL
ncbi:polyphosphoinositide phosphatase [Condylostylus longicornis]|uniref:polyphosphoinositide phosphatase n=1 Tax=Condylostylus longicornis TaxID=2530218 RepID=UPI00244DC7DE|nr:polyphosphoinositide phosphatase [Condylostylus longicornis]